MKKSPLVLLSLAMALSACTHVDPVFKDIGTRSGPCISGGPDQVAQQFYQLRTQQPLQGKPDAAQLSRYRPYLSDGLYAMLAVDKQSREKLARLPAADIFSSRAEGPTSARVHSASRIPNTDARNIPLRVSMTRSQGEGRPDLEWQDEVLMVREGTCWAIDDVRYLSPATTAGAGTLRQSLEERP